jgi:type VI secretion system protein ImpF
MGSLCTPEDDPYALGHRCSPLLEDVMADKRQEFGSAMSIADRLIDDEPQVSREPVPRRYQDLHELKQSVARDLKVLLNTRRECQQEPSEDYREARSSLLMYGLPDVSSLSLLNGQDRDRIRRALVQAIEQFEPRLKLLRVVVGPSVPHEPGLRFRIEAMLRIEPAPEQVAFDATLRLETKEYTVQCQNS